MSGHRNLLANDPEVSELIWRRDFVHAHLPWPKSFIETNSDFVFFFAHSRFLAWANDKCWLVGPGANPLSESRSRGKAAVGKTD
jgi:hypothetical protein